MERKIGSGLAVVPVLYALLILAFLYLHFSQFEDFSRQMKNVSYNGTMTTGRGIRSSRISQLNILSNGLEMEFSTRAPLTMVTEDNIRRDLLLQGVSRDENALILDFKYDTSIRISSDPASNNSAIEFTIPKTLPPVKELQLHAKAYLPYQLTRDDENRYMLTDGTSSFFLNMDQDFILQPKERILSVSMVDRTSSTLALEDDAPGLGRTLREWLAEEQSISDRAYQGVIDQFKAQAYSGLKSRFDKNLGEWSFPGERSRFDEETLVYHISEAYRHGEYSLLLPDLLKAADRHNNQLSWYSAPYTGDIVNKGAPFLRGNPDQLLRGIAELPIDGNPDLSPYKEILQLGSLMADSGSVDSEAWIEETIFPLIIWLEEGLFLFHPENPVSDTMLNLQAADLLIQAGERTSSDRLTQIGRTLMESQLSKADESGYLPALISFSRERPSQGKGFLRPEEIAGLFPRSSFSPRIMDVTAQLGEGSWLYTASESARVRNTDVSTDIILDFPRGQVHHLIIRGVAPFDRILLHGIRWKSDPRFQRYSDGWVYDSVNRTLYVKIRQRENREIISIRREILPPVPAPEAPPAEAETGTSADNT